MTLSKKSAALILAFAVAANVVALAAGQVSAKSPAPPAPKACLWRYYGPGTGWLKIQDNCDGNCSKPTGEGEILGDEQFTGCNSAQ